MFWMEHTKTKIFNSFFCLFTLTVASFLFIFHGTQLRIRRMDGNKHNAEQCKIVIGRFILYFVEANDFISLRMIHILIWLSCHMTHIDYKQQQNRKPKSFLSHFTRRAWLIIATAEEEEERKERQTQYAFHLLWVT